MNQENEIKEPIAETINSDNSDIQENTEKSPETPKDAISESLKQEVAEMKDKYLRLYSEFENFRRRTSKEKIELIGTANEKLTLALLPIADDIERSKASFETTEDIEALKEGINLIFNKFFKTLELNGVKALESKGTAFNADLHEAITQIPAPADDLKGKVVDEIEKGYYLNDKLIRVSKVVIGS